MSLHLLALINCLKYANYFTNFYSNRFVMRITRFICSLRINSIALIMMFFWEVFFGFWSWLADKLFISSLFMKLDFISQPSTNSTLPFAGLQHMQQCQVTFPQFQLSCFCSKLMVHDKWYLQWAGIRTHDLLNMSLLLLPLYHGVLPLIMMFSQCFIS